VAKKEKRRRPRCLSLQPRVELLLIAVGERTVGSWSPASRPLARGSGTTTRAFVQIEGNDDIGAAEDLRCNEVAAIRVRNGILPTSFRLQRHVPPIPVNHEPGFVYDGWNSPNS
jgi:hypothetical protein